MLQANYLSKASRKYENVIILVDFNIDSKTTGIDQEILQKFCNLFSLIDSVKSERYYTKYQRSLINLIFTNKSLKTTRITKTDPSNYHQLFTTFFKSQSVYSSSKAICHRNCKAFDKSKIFLDVKNKTTRIRSTFAMTK